MLRHIDPLKWIDDFLCSLRNGEGVKIEWLGGMDGADAEKMLRAHGVKVWGRQYAFDDGDHYGLTVRKAQAKWAAGLLAGHGCAIMTGPRGVKPIRPRHTWGAPAAAQGLGGAVAEMLGGAPEGRRRERRPRRERRR